MWGGTIETTTLVQPKVLYSTLGPPDSHENVYCVGPIKPYSSHAMMVTIFLFGVGGREGSFRTSMDG